MKRRVMLLTVVALMVTMAMGATPAFALQSPCPGSNGGILIEGVSPDYDPAYDRNDNGLICHYNRFDKDGFLVSTRYKDDHPT